MRALAVRKRSRGDDRGLAMLESIFVIPVVFAMILGILQVGLWWYAREVALTAAQQGSRAARDYNATSFDGTVSATAYLNQVDGTGGRVLLGPNVTAERNQQTVTVTVTGHIPSLLFFLPSHVREQSSGPTERFAPP